MFGGYHFDPEQEREIVSLGESLETMAVHQGGQGARLGCLPTKHPGA